MSDLFQKHMSISHTIRAHAQEVWDESNKDKGWLSVRKKSGTPRVICLQVPRYISYRKGRIIFTVTNKKYVYVHIGTRVLPKLYKLPTAFTRPQLRLAMYLTWIIYATTQTDYFWDQDLFSAVSFTTINQMHIWGKSLTKYSFHHLHENYLWQNLSKQY